MAGLKDIAELAGVSVGTVSLVLNGRARDLRISPETEEKIVQAARQLDYRPNTAARRLRRAGNENLPTIAVYWASDFPSELLGRFFIGIQNSLLDRHEFEVTVQPYRQSELHQSNLLSASELYNGVILTGVSDADIQFLEENPMKSPVVVFNRRLTSYSSVYVDDEEAGRKAAALFAAKGHKLVGMIAPDVRTSSINHRKNGFIHGAREHGMELPEACIYQVPMSMHGGQIAAEHLVTVRDRPTALFFPNGIMAVGALPVLHRAGIRIPDDLEIITYGDSEHERFTLPSLSSLILPVEAMASSCIDVLMKTIKGQMRSPHAERFETPFVFRESCIPPAGLE
ncbi:LacI family transcriptional regulator [Paenibacillus phyllosphaerae]|uniref:LacI family transcriptional regulator n=1 Tax=Paenibacillus phyllosphaerae TaxID=274593 RepID=A0A7W5ATL4_9BACL|nr:LacI family DNA-binding transcriptional regulator [Paenibacillus phyllosphaerae]MBB3108046.1 LacI family transcriptional regulator [Paenibacillus phyllosphaerae]